MHISLLVVLVLAGCGPARPPVGTRTILIEVPLQNATSTEHHLDPARCQACRRELRPGEKLVSCAHFNDEETSPRFGHSAAQPHDEHWDLMMCSLEAP